MSIATNLMQIQDRISDAASRSGRAVSDIQLVAVSKTVDRDMVDAAYAAGVRHFGENRVQDMRRKFEDPVGPDSVVHLIGHLQTNKVRDAVRYCQMIESVDRADLIAPLQRRCEIENQTLDMLIQVNVAGEDQKHGCAPEELTSLVDEAISHPNLRIRGLMTIAPLVDEPDEVRPVFRRLRELRDEIQIRFPDHDFSQLSMGMTNDFHVAIEEGATMIRLGRAVFGGQA